MRVGGGAEGCMGRPDVLGMLLDTLLAELAVVVWDAVGAGCGEGR